MEAPEATNGSTTDGLPVAPSLEPLLRRLHLPRRAAHVDGRVATVALLASLVAVACAFVARGLGALIGLVTSAVYYGRFSFDVSSPAGHRLGLWAAFVPVAGGLVVGLMARYGSKAIRGHGIPEAMEQVLQNESRIPLKMTFLKPVSAAIAIGTGGPFGAEGPIIATGSALGSVVGQWIRVSADERKTLLAAGAAAGMAATFGSPVSAVLLAVELLLFEYRARSMIPVALAASLATGVRIAMVGAAPVFPLANVGQPGLAALVAYVTLGALVGVAAVAVTRAVYAVEDGFERLPLHWALWPALGGVVVGVVGLFAPHTLGVGYDNIEQTLSGDLAGRALFVLCAAKLVSWLFALGSGTSGGTLAPLFTIGGGLGGLVTAAAAVAMPSLGLDPRIGALVGMAAMFAGASRALLASVVFAFEMTRQPVGLLPLLGGCTAAYFVSCLAMPTTIMTEKLARRGLRVHADYAVDFLDRVCVCDRASREVVTLLATQTVADVCAWLSSGVPGTSHQGFPVVDAAGLLVGVVTRRDLLAPKADPNSTLSAITRRAPVVVNPTHTLRDAADHMVDAGVGRVVVVDAATPHKVAGILTRSDLLGAYGRRPRDGRLEPAA